LGAPTLNLSSVCPCLPFPITDLSPVLVCRSLALLAAAAASAISLALEGDPPIDADAEFTDDKGQRSFSNTGFVLGYGEIRAASAILYGDIADAEHKLESSGKEGGGFEEHALATILQYAYVAFIWPVTHSNPFLLRTDRISVCHRFCYLNFGDTHRLWVFPALPYTANNKLCVISRV